MGATLNPKMGQFITPDGLPEDTFCRVLLIPNDPKWIGIVSGALLPMVYASEWVSYGGITPEQAANRANTMLQEFWKSDGCGEIMNCCEDQVRIKRFDPVTGRPQISVDNGVTWQSDPADTQNQIPLYPPPVNEGSSSTKCDAATNASEHIGELITATGENLATAETIFSLAIAVAETILALFLIIISAGTLTAPVTAVATAIWAAATGLFELGIEAYNAYWTVDKQDAILCALFCHIGDDGQFTEGQYAAFRAEVKDVLPASPALDIIMTAINAGGARGLSQMASYGNAAEADCDSCHCDETWCRIIDLTTESLETILHSYQPDSNPSVYNTVWTDGIGWQTANGDPNYSALQFQLSAIPGLRYFEFVSTGEDLQFVGDTMTEHGDSDHTSYGVASRAFDGTETYGYVVFGKRSRGIIYSIRFEGVGVNPFISSNC